MVQQRHLNRIFSRDEIRVRYLDLHRLLVYGEDVRLDPSSGLPLEFHNCGDRCIDDTVVISSRERPFRRICTTLRFRDPAALRRNKEQPAPAEALKLALVSSALGQSGVNHCLENSKQFQYRHSWRKARATDLWIASVCPPNLTPPGEETDFLLGVCSHMPLP